MIRRNIVIVGAGFGGLQVAKQLRGLEVDVTIVDRRNHHLFQPLLYQVATSVLATSEIAWPIRQMFRGSPNVRTLLGEVVGIDRDQQVVSLADGTVLAFDTLVLATGARHMYFGHDEWEMPAPGLKTLEDATTIRRRILMAFEKAEVERDEERRNALLTFGIVGAGPTGVELAGMIAELAQRTLVDEFRAIDSRAAKVLLIEAGPRLLPTFSEDLSVYAEKSLQKLGVEIHKGRPVTACTSTGINVGSNFIACETIIWAAGVKASDAAQWLGVPADRAGRVIVRSDLTIEGATNIYVIGDTAAVVWKDSANVPAIAPAAKQQGYYVARRIRNELLGKESGDEFRYRHLGNLATIGRNSAVIEFGNLKIRGWLAWWIWGAAHIYFLIGTRSRLAVAMSWLWISFSRQHSARLITQRDVSVAQKPLSEETTRT
ncbi:NAD(P)/FAD-dependent oxidoreductase [Rhizobium sp. WYCCWR 11146]|uniref:NAD(P)/FAD-dependent oxidoreductase n=1 Tax=Rhizobium sp. WYCCWR 11146 TaxID=2749833 RepID=UPI0015E72636|nr:NAD(P)/FAD-dependent oxidoreductase [Rhizobium sp. WYCCWR 11146]MBA1344916.1 NAD(P)/FAD-dependent oxidoreductase [Rhizobium sp. WYCCWR 11146]